MKIHPPPGPQGIHWEYGMFPVPCTWAWDSIYHDTKFDFIMYRVRTSTRDYVFWRLLNLDLEN